MRLIDEVLADVKRIRTERGLDVMKIKRRFPLAAPLAGARSQKVSHASLRPTSQPMPRFA